MRRAKNVVVGVAIIMAMMAAVVPAVVLDARRSAAAPVPAPDAAPAPADAVDTTALALSAAERGYRELVLSPGAWSAVQLGHPPAGFDLDSVYDEPGVGAYAVRLASGPLPGQVTITAVARSADNSSTRAVRVVYDYFPNSSLREVDCRWDGSAPRCP